jgi:hypothetical protein
MPPAASAQSVVQDLQLPIPDFKPGPPPQAKESPANDKDRFNKPIYNPETKSYFEYFITAQALGRSADYWWGEAKQLAQTRSFHGVRGRLAIVKTKETNDFIVKHFRPENGTWIGLQYLCHINELRWADGEFWPRTGYQNWYQPWNIQGPSPRGGELYRCAGTDAMGVHYWGQEGGYKWNANHPAKKFYNMILEYPTGKP